MLTIENYQYTALSLESLTNSYTSSIGNLDSSQFESKQQTDLSQLGRAAAYTGLDIGRSSRSFTQESLDFDFSYSSNHVQNIHATGVHDYQSSKLEFHLAFEVQESQLTGTGSSNRSFKFELDFSIENVQFQQVNVSQYKEDIGDYLMRIAKTIADYAQDDDKEITALILDIDDAKELFNLENGKLMKNLLAAIGIIYMTNHLLGQDKEDVALYIPRKKGNLIEYTSLQHSNMQLAVNITEMNASRQEPSDRQDDKEMPQIQEEKPEAKISNKFVFV